MTKPTVLCILDGWGIRDITENNAIAMANTPNFDNLWNERPKTTLRADGLFVGLPDGQFGNSEVGHMNIGCGRVVMQDLPRITLACQDGSIAGMAAIEKLIATLKQSGGVCHLMGLMSPGGVHSHQDHIVAVAKAVSTAGIPVRIHAFMDGRDTPPQSGAGYMANLENAIADMDDVTVATVSGRFYAMDRDNRWERVEQAFNAVMFGRGVKVASSELAIKNSYAAEKTDEFIVPCVIGDYEGMMETDGVMMANYRADRAREIMRAIVETDFDGFNRGTAVRPVISVGMAEYSAELNAYLETVFPPEEHNNILGEIVSKAGLKQLRTAETEKYPHVTFFFNGGNETPFEGEDRILIPSPKVATYDMQPEMSARELTASLIEQIESDKYDFIVVNFANPDMVGHTGSIPAAIKAVETVDECLGRVVATVIAKGGCMFVTADHGNADMMIDPKTSEPYTAHTSNPVPFIAVDASDTAYAFRNDGKLGDIAATLLKRMGIEKPADMTGTPLY